MLYNEVQKAIAEAERFIEAAKKLKQATSEEGHLTFGWVEPGMACATVKRASLDLTRQLSVIRKP